MSLVPFDSFKLFFELLGMSAGLAEDIHTVPVVFVSLLLGR